MPDAHLGSTETLCRRTRQTLTAHRCLWNRSLLQESLVKVAAGGSVVGRKPLELSTGSHSIQKRREWHKMSLPDVPENDQVVCLPCLPPKWSHPASLGRLLPVGTSLLALHSLSDCTCLLPSVNSACQRWAGSGGEKER